MINFTCTFFKFIRFILCLGLLYLCVLDANAQWLDWRNETDTRLVLSSVANSDNQEKDISTADLNNDGWEDVVIVRKEPFSLQTVDPESDLLLININGVLTDQTALYAPEFLTIPSFGRDLVIDDFDGDGWQDIVIANTFNQRPFYYANLGLDTNGNWLGFENQSSDRFPATLDNTPLICAVWSGDINGDNVNDLYFSNYRLGEGQIAKDFLFINNGDGIFTDESEERIGYDEAFGPDEGSLRNSSFGTAVQIVDIDGDGDNDILKVSTLFGVPPWDDLALVVLFNEDNGYFSNWQQITPSLTSSPYMFTVEDYNNDGLLDVFVVDDARDFTLLTNSIVPNESINMVQVNTSTDAEESFGGNVHRGDFDLDGDIDLIVSDVDVDIPPCESDRSLAILRNDNNVFTDPYSFTEEDYDWATNSYDVGVLDINRDGLLDFITGGCEGYGVYMNSNCDLNTNTNLADFDNDGLIDMCDPCPNNPNLDCNALPSFPTVSTDNTVARQWNELLLESIRLDFARPTVHARNLFHTSVGMYDIWAVYDDNASTYLLGKTVEGFTCNFDGIATPGDVEAARDEAISYMAYRLLLHRFQNSPGVFQLRQAYDYHLTEVLGYDASVTSQDYSTGSAAALGNYVAQCIIDYGLQDNANEQNDYANQYYSPVNSPLIVDETGNPSLTDYNRWQPLTLDIFIDQSGNEIEGSTPGFLSPEWGAVNNFALSNDDLTVYNRAESFDYRVFHDPGTPPYLSLNGSGDSEFYAWGFETVVTWSSHLDATDGVMMNISPASLGNRVLPNSIEEYPSFYDQLNGGTTSNGHSINPITGAPYATNIVRRADYARVLAEFWADGPDSETPPGHWFTLLNYVDDHPALSRRFKGEGPELSQMEWEIKAYFTLGGAMHDAAVTAWGIKGWYDYIRPISAIRAMAALGQRTNPQAANYHPAGIALIPGYIETIQASDPLTIGAPLNVGKIKVRAWRGHDVINNVDVDVAGVDWILAEDWIPYQRPSFVTPPFAGYVSGHSTYSRAAAEVLGMFTGDTYFPGGLGEFVASQNEFLVFEDGPSSDVVLQWATYKDAADESGLSRIWGGIHPPVDDIRGRIIGEQIGIDAFNLAEQYFNGNDGDDDDECRTINRNDFEEGLGIWNDGGPNCLRVSSSTFSESGIHSVRLKRASPSATVTTNSLDLSSSSEINVSFSYITTSMSRSHDDFWLQISLDGGASYTTVEEWNYGDEFENNQRYQESISISGPFTEATRIRFRCDATAHSKRVYLDNIVIGNAGVVTSLVDSNDFEDDFGIWNDGGSNCLRVSSSTFSESGIHSIRLKRATPSATVTTNSLDLSSSSEINVSFSYITTSMSRSHDDFWLQISLDGGASYTTVEEWNYGDEFENNQRYQESISISGPFTEATRIRFRGDATAHSKRVYLDNITINKTSDCFDTNSSRLRTNQLNLKVSPKQEEVGLYWLDDSPIIDGYYEIQYSTDSMEFSTIATKIKNGDLLYIDKHSFPIFGNNYYRIKLNEKSGRIQYSNIQNVRFERLADFELFPNPASSYVDVNLEPLMGKELEIKVYNNLGQSVMAINLEEDHDAFFRIQLGTFKEGLYFFGIQSKGRKAITKKLLITE